MKKIRRLPTILGLLILLIGIGAGAILIHQGSSLFLRAGTEIIPQQIKITNISEDSLTVSWVTDTPTSGFVKYGTEKNLTMTAEDDRDQLSDKTGNFVTHHVTLKSLKLMNRYYFKLGSGGRLFDNNGQLYEVTTGPSLQSPPPPNDVAYGTVLAQDGSPASGIIVYLSLANASPLSTFTKSSGAWAIPLNLARLIDLSSYLPYDQELAIEEIFVQGGQLGTATAVATTQNDSPMPPITLGQSFDFRKTGEFTPSTTSPTPPVSKFSFQEVTPPSASSELTILNPHQGEEINTPRPELMGRGPAGVVLSVSLQSPSIYSGTIQVDSQGNWQWTPPVDLPAGEHTVTIAYTDGEGKEQKISRSFIVLAAGESELPAFTATPSATATPSPTPTASPSARTSMPSTEEGVPTAGVLTPTFLVFIMGTILMALGLATNILSRKIK